MTNNSNVQLIISNCMVIHSTISLFIIINLVTRLLLLRQGLTGCYLEKREYYY